MAFLQTKFFHPANFKPSTIEPFQKKAKGMRLGHSGFMALYLLPLTGLMITGMMGLFFLSMGIKNITKAQSHCIRANLQGQKELGLLMAKILNLNTTVLKLKSSRKTVEASLITALSFGLFPLASMLKKKLSFIKRGQEALMAKQVYLLAQGRRIKKKSLKNLKRRLKNLKISHVREQTFYKKALALQKEKAGDRAYIYKPAPDFTQRQTIRFAWKARIFSPLDKHFQWIWPASAKNSAGYTCSASLKSKGKQWIEILYH